MKSKKILITGGLGFIGSNLAIKLVELGNNVTIIDNLDPNCGGNEYNIKSIEKDIKLIDGNINNSGTIERAVKNKEYIFNLAGQVSHVSSIEGGAREDLETNCMTSLNLLESCRLYNQKARVLYTGTRGQYGKIISSPVSESHSQRPKDINDIHKMATELYHMVYTNQEDGLWTTTLRLTNIYGPRHQMKDKRSGFIGHFVRQALDNKTIELFDGGNQIRDMCYVNDAIDAMIKTIECNNARGEAFNVTSGYGYSLRIIAEKIINITKSGKIKVTPYEKGFKTAEIGDFIGDISKIENIVGWKPKTSLEEGLRKMINYYQRHKKHYW